MGMDRKETAAMMDRVAYHLECMKAFVAGKDIQYRTTFMHDWADAPSPAWVLNTEYRVKPNLYITNLKPGQKFRTLRSSIYQTLCTCCLMNAVVLIDKRYALPALLRVSV